MISDMMKQELFLESCIFLLEEFQLNTAFPNMPKLIITTLSTFLKHQQSSSQLVRKIDRHTLNNSLMEVFFRRTLQEDLRLLLAKSYTQFIYALGSRQLLI
jgi:hypothetical protein